jgi:hypothetical protein
MAIFPAINLTCRNDWTIFSSVCRRSLMLQPWKLEVISLISSEREFPLFLCALFCGRMLVRLIDFPIVWGSRIYFPGVMPVKTWGRMWEVEEVVSWQASCIMFVYTSVFFRSWLWSLASHPVKLLGYCLWQFAHIGVVLVWSLVFTGEKVSAAFRTFWSETGKLSFVTKVLTSVALERATQSNVNFVWKSPTRSLVLRVVCSTMYIMTYRGKKRDLLCCRFWI